MTRDELLAKLRDLKPWLAEQGVVNVRLFGSFARDEAGPDSDVDLLVDVDRPLGLAFLGVEQDVADHVGRKVDLVRMSDLENPFLRKYVLRDACPI